MACMKRLASRIGSFWSDRSGNIAIIFGLAIVPVMGLMGMALDYSFASKVKTELQAAADDAVLVAVTNTAMSLPAATVQQQVVDYFNAQATNRRVNFPNPATATVTDSGVTRTAVLSFTASVPTSLLGVVGLNSIAIAGSSTASNQFPPYIDFYLLLDNTPSMGVGATPTDVQTMVSHTSDKCAFACHQMDKSPNDYYGLAKNLGVTMRIDVVRTATQNLMDKAMNTETVPNQFRMAIYTFGASAQNAGLTNIFALSSDLASAKTAAGVIDLMTVPYQNYADDTDTDFDAVFTSMNNNEITNPGDGTAAGKPQKVLFFVSDGVADEVNASCNKPITTGSDPKTNKSYKRCQEPINVSLCTAMKNRGIQIAVLYTTYLALPTNNWYVTWIDPFNKGPYNPSINSEIAQNMKNCASPGFYFEVSPTQGISAAMNALFQKVVQVARLTK
jgi:Flp pilus assembly protein TadG